MSDREHPETQFRPGNRYREQKRFAEAIAAYEPAEPGDRQALANLTHLLCSLRRYLEAAPRCAEFVRRYPDGEATVWVDLGICQHAAHEPYAYSLGHANPRCCARALRRPWNTCGSRRAVPRRGRICAGKRKPAGWTRRA